MCDEYFEFAILLSRSYRKYFSHRQTNSNSLLKGSAKATIFQNQLTTCSLKLIEKHRIYCSPKPIAFIFFLNIVSMITTDEQLDKLKYPIGPFKAPENITDEELEHLINIVAAAPAEYRKITANLSDSSFKKTYRPGSWNVQQVVNHVADMELLHYFRMKKALTETDYKEITLVNIDGWAQTQDTLNSPISDALDMMDALTKRFVFLMQSLDETQKEIAYYHPIRKIMLNQKQAIAMAAWHVRHHLGHLEIALRGA